MASYYTIFGQKVASQYLVFATWGALGLGIYSSKSGKKADVKALEPKIQASSVEEESFIKEFLKNEDKKSAPKH